MSKGIESRTFLWSSASFKIIKIGILLPPVRRFDFSKVSIHRFNVNFFYISQTCLLFRFKKSIDRWIIRIERLKDMFLMALLFQYAYFLSYICLFSLLLNKRV